jgi:leader peptidase (prepilin peptidase) / N-methyltransferase
VNALAVLFAESPALLIGTMGLLGLLVGSFLNVVIHRVPIMLDREWRAQCVELTAQDAGSAGSPPAASAGAAPATASKATTETPYNLVVPRSACPACKAPITASQNIPLVSWLMLKGACASCGARISARYPLVELLTGVLSGLVAWKFGFGWPLACALGITWVLVALTFIDLDTQLLPDSLTLPLMWAGLAAALVFGSAAPLSAPVDLRGSVIGAIAGYLSLWSVYHLFRLITGKEGMGYGDFKLLAALGAWLGWQMILPIVLMSALVGALVGVALMMRFGRDRNVPMAFGPYLAAAGWIMLMWGPEIVGGYLGMWRPTR